jgi:hypothetical protein
MAVCRAARLARDCRGVGAARLGKPAGWDLRKRANSVLNRSIPVTELMASTRLRRTAVVRSGSRAVDVSARIVGPVSAPLGHLEVWTRVAAPREGNRA